MCLGCYGEMGYPATITDAALKAADLVGRVYDFSCVGGNLHCQIDDWNLEDQHFDDGYRDFLGRETTPDQAAAEHECFDALKALDIEARHVALAISDGYLNRDGTYPDFVLGAMEEDDDEPVDIPTPPA